MPARSVVVTLNNDTGLNLRLTSAALDGGMWSTKPPALIVDGHGAMWESESDGFLTGTEGRAEYRIETVVGVHVGDLQLHWNNPWVTSNEYDESVDPLGDGTVDAGFSIGHDGGDGDNASVTFTVAPGNCHVGGGEYVCAFSQALTSERERYAAIWEQRVGAPWYGLHGLTPARYQEVFDDLVRKGFRPLQVDGYASGADEERYAAIFERRDGPPFAAHHGLTADEHRAAGDALVAQGFRPVDLSGYTRGDEERFAAIFEQRDGPPFATHLGLTAGEHQDAFDALVGRGFRPVHVSGYEVSGEERYAAIFEQRDGPPFAAVHGLTSEGYQKTFDKLIGDGYRPVCVSGYAAGGEERYAAIFEQRGGPALAARHGLTPEEYQQAFDGLGHDGFRLVHVSGYGIA